jgi:hypothetical protein
MRNNNKEINFDRAQSNKMSKCSPASLLLPIVREQKTRKSNDGKVLASGEKISQIISVLRRLSRPFSSLNQKRFGCNRAPRCAGNAERRMRHGNAKLGNPFRTPQFIFSLAIAFMINNCNNHFNKHTKCIFPNGLISIRIPRRANVSDTLTVVTGCVEGETILIPSRDQSQQ